MLEIKPIHAKDVADLLVFDQKQANNPYLDQEDLLAYVFELRQAAGYQADKELIAWQDGKIVGHVIAHERPLYKSSIENYLFIALNLVVPAINQVDLYNQLANSLLALAEKENYDLVIAIADANNLTNSSWQALDKLKISNRGDLSLSYLVYQWLGEPDQYRNLSGEIEIG
ncbi:hypothetical protein AWM75_06220 [Aerococcus urinaehominis]|uniref:Uncharacterized protein n=1 Tax=Aerococcus urinaehominis TaxID=128944 RepID=A0A0X8FLP5_9LACT|nr:hypothetical protein [Aerococcus urinaehominis]AMB99600.1 hypothetical protein AWM75_06220 [Aerococcus urinaehominis]SDL86995.1 hypothetical protein SAMN04487985_10242 [Aerococcus urinaehominis]